MFKILKNSLLALSTIVLFTISVSAQAIVIGKISMMGQVRVTGPGGTVYVGAEGEAPILPGSGVQVGDGKAIADLAGRGSITINKNSSLNFSKNGTPQLNRGSFQIKVLPGKSIKVVTPKGEMIFQAQKEKSSLFSVIVTDKGLRAQGSGIILAGGKTFNPGQTLLLGALEGGGIGAGALIGAGFLMAAGAGVAIAVSSGGGAHHHRASPSSPE